MMARGDQDVFWIGAILLAAYAWDKWTSSAPAQALQRGGAALYETLHPAQRAHADDLPGHQMTKAAVEELAARVGFPDPHLAMAVAMAESGGAPNAYVKSSREESVGLWQINIRAHPNAGTREQLRDPEYNARVALALSRTPLGWNHWSTYKNGKFGAFL